MRQTKMGRGIRAVAQDAEAALMMGVDMTRGSWSLLRLGG